MLLSFSPFFVVRIWQTQLAVFLSLCGEECELWIFGKRNFTSFCVIPLHTKVVLFLQKIFNVPSIQEMRSKKKNSTQFQDLTLPHSFACVKFEMGGGGGGVKPQSNRQKIFACLFPFTPVRTGDPISHPVSREKNCWKTLFQINLSTEHVATI